MNLQQIQTITVERPGVRNESDTRLHGRWLLLARGVWITLVVLTLVIFFASLPVYLAQLQTPCTGPTCQYQQLTPGQVETLKFLALFMLVFSLFPTGQFVPSFMRWTLVVFLAVQVPITFFPAAPFMPDTAVSQLGWLVSLGQLATLAFVQLYRYRRVSSPLQQQQLLQWCMVPIE